MNNEEKKSDNTPIGEGGILIPSDNETIEQLNYSEPEASKQKRSELNAKEDVAYRVPKKSVSKTPFTNFSKGEKALLGLTILFIAASATSLSFLLSEGYPNKLYSRISLAISVTAMLVTALVFCCYPSKSKEGGEPSSQLKGNEINEAQETKKSM